MAWALAVVMVIALGCLLVAANAVESLNARVERLIIEMEEPKVLEAEWCEADGTIHRVKTKQQVGESEEAFVDRHAAIVERDKKRFPPKPV